jgi:anti-sigma B factor antagonist
MRTAAVSSEYLMSLYVVEKALGDVTLLDLRGRITLGPETVLLRDRVKKLVDAGHARIVLNLELVDYIDSVGLGTLIASYTSVCKRGGELKLLHLTRRVRDLLQITRLITVFETFEDLEAARRSFARPPPP